jgi:hypothetical protein
MSKATPELAVDRKHESSILVKALFSPGYVVSNHSHEPYIRDLCNDCFISGYSHTKSELTTKYNDFFPLK